MVQSYEDVAGTWKNHDEELIKRLDDILKMINQMKSLLNSLGDGYISFQKYMLKQAYSHSLDVREEETSQMIKRMNATCNSIAESFMRYKMFSSALSQKELIQTRTYSLISLLQYLGEDASVIFSKMVPGYDDPTDYYNE